ncbi:MAG TPA: flagellar biosynthesis protein FlhB [Spirochaetia bacterium]|nr:flagellar biosynthesis protein FlhB [Spirochaetia bacterium]
MRFDAWFFIPAHIPSFLLKNTPFELRLLGFAAEDEGRTEEPTEHKIRKAREEGKVAKSVEFTSALVLLASIVTLGLMSTYFITNTVDMLKYFFNNFTEIDVTSDNRVYLLFLKFFTRLVLPVVIASFAAALLGNLLQVGFLFSVKPIIPDFSKIVPRFGRYFKRAFLSGEAFFNLGKSIFKVVLISVLAFLNIRAEIEKISNLVTMPFLVGFELIASIAFRIVVETAIAMLFLSIFDYYFQKRQHMEALKMSKQEVKEERKMYEGDPLIKSRLRERMREILMRNMIQAVPKADVIITNPTHYSVALEYNRVVNPAPVVVAKGVDSMAQKIREIAKEHSVPIVENKPLARALYTEVEIGDSIPEKFYEVLATILAEVYRINGKTAEAV